MGSSGSYLKAKADALRIHRRSREDKKALDLQSQIQAQEQDLEQLEKAFRSIKVRRSSCPVALYFNPSSNHACEILVSSDVVDYAVCRLLCTPHSSYYTTTHPFRSCSLTLNSQMELRGLFHRLQNYKYVSTLSALLLLQVTSHVPNTTETEY